MKYLVFIFSMLLLSTVTAQKSNVVIFSQEGQRFTVILNGVRMNLEPQTNVKITDLTDQLYKGKIIFEDGTPDIDKNIYTKDTYELTYHIKQKNNGEYVLRPLGETLIASASAPAPDQQTYTYGDPGNPVAQSSVNNNPPSTGNNSIDVNINSGTNSNNGSAPQQTTNTTNQNNGTTQVTATLNGNSINLSDGRSISVTYKKLMFPYPELEMLQPMGASVSVIYEGNNAFSSEVPFNYDKLKVNEYFKLDVKETNQVEWSIKILAKTGFKVILGGDGNCGSVGSGGGGCSTPMNSSDFEEAKKTITAGSFAETQLKSAKQIAESNCLSINQVIEVCNLFSFDETKLDFAKHAYQFCIDKSNYFKVSNVFSFPASKDKLNDYISNQK